MLPHPLFLCLRFVLVCACFGVVMSSPVVGQDQTAPSDPQQFGDWTAFCPDKNKLEQETATNPDASCALIQKSVIKGQTDLSLMAVLVQGAEGLILRVQTPLGVLIPQELGLWIDGENIGAAPFLRCLATGCVSEVVMPDALVAAFSGGEQAVFVIHFQDDKGVGIPISLQGFSDALSVLQRTTAGQGS